MYWNSLMEKLDLKVARKIPINQVEKYKMIPLYEEEDTIFVVTSDVYDNGKSFLEFLFQKKLRIIEVREEDIKALINLIFNYDYDSLEETILEEAVKEGVSDIHFEPVSKGVNIRFRINGTLLLVRKLMLEDYLKVLSRLKIKANMDITEKRKPQDGKIIINIKDYSYNCRLSTIPIIHGEKLVLRVLYGEKFLYSIDKLNFKTEQGQVLKNIIGLNSGLVLVTGPTGSGKSTTLYTILNTIKDGHINITTLEDPIEVTMEGVNQINLNPKIGITFASGLRSVLRQDPDVIMVGEIRDEETARMAIRAAITGHKVYSTIHTNSPMEVYHRLQEMGVPRYLVNSAIVGIVSQRLIKLLCCDCKRKIGKIERGGKTIDIYQSKGCNKCKNTGYRTRALVSSVNYIDKSKREILQDSLDSKDFLNNKQMLEILDELLEAGKIDYYDYLNFLQGEEMNEV